MYAISRGHIQVADVLRSWPTDGALLNQLTLKLCISDLKRRKVYELVVQDTPTNELTRPMFVFKVLEEMMSRGMYGLAEDVVKGVGRVR